MPRLIARATPNFSFFLMLRSQSIAHGRRARAKSLAPEYAMTMGVSIRTNRADT
jgi:hypothetical protein